MGTQKDSTYYDRVYRENGRYQKPPEEQPWVVLWQEIARHCTGQSVLDVGCGQGHLFEFVKRRAAGYIGLDFSEEAITQARAAYNEDGIDYFGVLDITKDFVPHSGPHGWLYVFCEVLEHLEDDLAVLAKVPGGCRVIITVPTQDSESHVRHFPNQEDAVLRYTGLVDIEEAKTIHLKSKPMWHFLRGTRR